MINQFEKNILGKIDFVKRYHELRNSFHDDKNKEFTLKNKNVRHSLNSLGYTSTNKKNLHIIDIIEHTYTFRLIFDIKGKSILSYIFVLKDGNFIENGLSHFGYLLNFFDVSNLTFNENFAINSDDEFVIYSKQIIDIFLDFKEEFLKSLP